MRGRSTPECAAHENHQHSRHLLEECPQEMDQISSLLWIGYLRNKSSSTMQPCNRLRCCLGGHCVIATVDSGSDLNMMSPKCAKREGFQIDSSPEVRRYIIFGDGSQGETVGQGYVYRLTLDWREPETKTSEALLDAETDNSQIAENELALIKRTERHTRDSRVSGVVFHVLPGLPCDVVLGRDLLDKTDAFNLFPGLLSSKPRGMAEAFEFKILISRTRRSKRIPGFRGQEQGNTAAPHSKAAHDNDRHAEMYRRSEREAELAALPLLQRAREEAREKRRVRDWNAAHLNCVHCNPV